jgi:P-type Cu2+ transporter
MQAVPVSPVFFSGDAHGHAAMHLAVHDEPDEWPAFGRPVNSPQSVDGSLWESHVFIQGMHCAACSLVIEQALLGVAGVQSVRVSAASQRASVVWSSAQTRPSTWMAAPLAQGYRLFPLHDSLSLQHEKKQARLALWRWLVAGFCMMQVMMYAYPAYIAGPQDITPDIAHLLRWASWVLTLPVVLFSCGPFFRNAWRDLRQRRISMDLPVALGIVITFIISSAATFEPHGWWSEAVYFDSLTMFVFFLLTGRWLEQRLHARTSGALESLMNRLPHSVERLGPDGVFVRVAVRRLAVGDLVRVLPGEAFPADGSITLGNTQVDEALLTGESRPLSRGAGAHVMAGSYNLLSAVQVRIDHIGEATRYAQIVALMLQASLDKPRLALLADRVARPFLWGVLLAAGLAAAWWWPTDPARAVMAAVAVLIVTCPCALSLATPAAMLSSAGRLARQGVLVRRLQALESLAGIDTVVFDKTGTLTQARMGLMVIETREGVASDQALALAAALAAHSLHPVSKALVAAGQGLSAQVKLGEVAEVEEILGQGLQARLTKDELPAVRLRLGSPNFCGVQSSDERQQVFLADAHGMLACFTLDEVVRPEAAAAVSALLDAGLQVHMLTGDRAPAAARVATRLGIKRFTADCSPSDKLAHVRALQAQGRRVLMVGDGLNDGPVLASANVSIAIGSSVPLSQSHSDLVMPCADLLLLPELMQRSVLTIRIVRQNLMWAAAYNALCVPLAITGTIDAWLAGLGMALSSLLVIANASRLAVTHKGSEARAATRRKGELLDASEDANRRSPFIHIPAKRTG